MFSLGLPILLYWGETLWVLCPKPLDVWRFLIWLMGADIVLGPVWAPSFIPLKPSCVSLPSMYVGEVLFHCVLASSLLKFEEEPLQISGILSLGMSLLSMLWPRNSSCLPPLISQLYIFNSGSHRALCLGSHLHALWPETRSRPLAGAIVGLTLFVSHFSWIIVLCCLMSNISNTVVTHIMYHL